MPRVRLPRATVAAFGGLVLLISCVFLASSCVGPQAPATAAGDPRLSGRYTDGALRFQLDGVDGAQTDLELVATALEFDATAEELHAQVAVHNRGDRPALGPASIVVSGFIPAEVAPLDATCGGASADGCSYDYSGAYGSDGVLEANETSTPIAWRLHVPGGVSFAFRAQLVAAAAASGEISGVVFEDQDGDGARDAGEIGVPNVSVRLQSPSGSQDASSDAQGHYAFHVDAPGIYAIHVDAPNGWHTTTTQPLQVTILRATDGSLSGFALGDVGLAHTPAGPTITVEGFAFVDLDRDGQRGAGEPGLAAVKIRGRACAHHDDDDKPADDGEDDDFEARTDSLGHYSLTLPDCGGPWDVRGGSVENYDRTSPKTVRFTAPPAPGESLHADFGYAAEAEGEDEPEDGPDGSNVGTVGPLRRTLVALPALRVP